MALQNSHISWDARLYDRLANLKIAVDPCSLSQPIEEIKAALHTYGFAVLNGLGSAQQNNQLNETLIDVSEHLGTLLPQSPRGERVEDVKDYSDIDEKDDRGYRSKGELTPHSDPPTLILLHCLKAAKAGGESHIVNVASICKKIESIDKNLLNVLFQKFPHWRVAGPNGSTSAGPAQERRPILAKKNGNFSCVLYRPFLEKALDALGETLSGTEIAALDLFDKCANDPALTLRFILTPGETLLLHNRTVLHARTDYEDWPAIEDRRHILRTWIDAPELLPVSTEHELGDIFEGAISFIN